MAKKENCRDFGSFQASNVQELISIPEEQCTFLNHGAFGCVIKEAIQIAQQWQLYAERQPLRFFDRELLPHLVFVTRRLAKFVGCDASDLALLTNATMGINSVLRSLTFSQGDIIVCLSVTYGAVKKLLRQICEDTGAELKEIHLDFPITGEEQVVDAVRQVISKENVKLAVLDHIPSNAPFILPLETILPICHQHGTKVLIDGAHALGSLNLHLEKLNVDFYVSNCHKWFCSPKGAAFLYVRKDHKNHVRPLVISHGYGYGFSSEFIWSGLKDYSPFLALHTVLDFWHAAGPDSIHRYMRRMSSHAADVLLSSWRTSLAAPISMFGSMILVQLPATIYAHKSVVDYNEAEKVQNLLYHRFNIEVPVKALQGKLYVRVSLHIHTTEDDIWSLAKAVSSLHELYA
ncbi:probable L-cysteine desulfhydrase, chloroplastic isoform X2 [Pomacea canaliculata]|uniref:probable L-cysteine desulfhydrase, chloroplastic isoform X2 n=1 Tax=Pomacea canaliculata TaxID=400727 RepID=UPI000D730631|nr:probable L-cysteine desulfhydrase, chloroplastic isoform X2 [Pomacea canaliculata]XP_025097549.1 probable L-cysteine desulfhydrase, chloroplastic isoform X2 [Pomacea canaliculata]